MASHDPEPAPQAQFSPSSAGAFENLREMLGNDHIRLATEAEFKGAFPDCEIGAMPPFGNLYGMPVYVASSLAEDEEISFNAGSHSEVIQMAYEDFEQLSNPMVLDFVTT